MARKSLKIAVKALRTHKLRTGLALLGMTIGVAAVLTMFALGTGAQHSVSSSVKSAGTTVVLVRAGNFTRGGEDSNIATGLGSATSLTPSDADAIRSQVQGIAHVSEVARMRGWVSYDDQKNYGQVYGVNVEYPQIYDWDFQHGKFFKKSDVSDASNVAVIGSGLSEALFGDSNPDGEEIEIHGEKFKVKGVFTTSDEDQSQMAIIPYTTMQRLLGINYLQLITVAAEQAGDASQIAKDITPLLRSRHRLDSGNRSPQSMGLGGLQGAGGGGGTPDDFTVKTQASEALTKGLNTSVAAFILANMQQMDQVNLQEMSGTLSRAGQTMTALLTAIATISLIVGGIGIMNVMLVSVTERKREIGIRRAVGARARDVLMQFLTEAVTLGLAGGVLGIAFGYLASLVITYALEWQTTVSIGAVALAFGIAAATGVFFGFYPALRASKLNPIDALRFE